MFIAGSLDGLSGPPTPFALRVRPWLMAVFVALALVGAARLVLLDVTGGLFLVLAVFIGYMAIRPHIRRKHDDGYYDYDYDCVMIMFLL